MAGNAPTFANRRNPPNAAFGRYRNSLARSRGGAEHEDEEGKKIRRKERRRSGSYLPAFSLSYLLISASGRLCARHDSLVSTPGGLWCRLRRGLGAIVGNKANLPRGKLVVSAGQIRSYVRNRWFVRLKKQSQLSRACSVLV